MSLQAVSYLQTLSTIAVTFVGFAALVIILRQALGGEMSKMDILLTRIFIQLGFMVAAGSLLPSLLGLFPWSTSVVWRLSSAIVGVPTLLFALTSPARRRVASGVPAPWGVWLDVFVLSAVGAC
jgi:hypothetical protein